MCIVSTIAFREEAPAESGSLLVGTPLTVAPALETQPRSIPVHGVEETMHNERLFDIR